MTEEEMQQLKKTIDELSEQNKTLKTELKKYSGFDVAEAQKAMQFKDEYHRKLDEDRGNYDKLVSELKSDFETQSKALKSALEEEMIGNRIGRLIASKGGDSEILLSYLRQNGMVKVSEQQGSLQIETLFDGTPVAPEKFVENLAANERFDRYFIASGTSGGGSKTTAVKEQNDNSPYTNLFSGNL